MSSAAADPELNASGLETVLFANERPFDDVTAGVG
jgi:hypothetical protein